MENHPFLWRRIRRVRRIQVCMARKGLSLQSESLSWFFTFVVFSDESASISSNIEDDNSKNIGKHNHCGVLLRSFRPRKSKQGPCITAFLYFLVILSSFNFFPDENLRSVDLSAACSLSLSWRRCHSPVRNMLSFSDTFQQTNGTQPNEVHLDTEQTHDDQFDGASESAPLVNSQWDPKMKPSEKTCSLLCRNPVGPSYRGFQLHAHMHVRLQGGALDNWKHWNFGPTIDRNLFLLGDFCTCWTCSLFLKRFFFFLVCQALFIRRKKRTTFMNLLLRNRP